MAGPNQVQLVPGTPSPGRPRSGGGEAPGRKRRGRYSGRAGIYNNNVSTPARGSGGLPPDPGGFRLPKCALPGRGAACARLWVSAAKM